MKHFIGLDVSMNSTGWAVLSLEDDGTVQYVDSGIIRANTKHSHGVRLTKQRKKFEDILREYPEGIYAREAGFSRFVRATQTLFKAYGMTDEFFSANNLVEIAPTTIKKCITGNGKAEKESVEFFIREKVKFPDGFEFESNDESDAVAIAFTLIQNEKGEL